MKVTASAFDPPLHFKRSPGPASPWPRTATNCARKQNSWQAADELCGVGKNEYSRPDRGSLTETGEIYAENCNYYRSSNAARMALK